MADEKARPVITCLCGSTRFEDAYREAARQETLAGRIVLSVGLFGHQEGLDMGGSIKVMLDELHLEKIRLSKEILVINVGDYVGTSTRREIAFARANGKHVRWWQWPSTHALSADTGVERGAGM